MMKYVLCYGDSNTWGASPDQLPRYEFAERWTGIVQENLKDGVHIYENGLNGRTTVFHDDVELGRNGRVGFDTVLDMNAPLDLVIIMLGTNDCKQRFSNHPAWDVALGMQNLVKIANNPQWGREMTMCPKILVVAPVKMGYTWENSWIKEEFGEASSQKADQLAELYELIAQNNNVGFLDASQFASPGIDCVHMTKESHAELAKAMTEKIKEMLNLT